MGILQARILEWVAMPSSRGQKHKQELTQPQSQGGTEPAVCIGVSSFGGGSRALLTLPIFHPTEKLGSPQPPASSGLTAGVTPPLLM